MRVVLDANEYVFAFGPSHKPDCLEALRLAAAHDLRICRSIVREVLRNLPPKAHGDFFDFLLAAIASDPEIDEDFAVPFELGASYEDQGFKPADALIAAYIESIGADVLVSENRHFLAKAARLPFAVHNAKSFVETFLPPV
ncbi:MAG: type II toxin-antitoxin system VapC family toxin [Planctomycetes bacterium]|nr:type II toxin-antitoxin system VapC family toxin [Planctomycetota bacterium]